MKRLAYITNNGRCSTPCPHNGDVMIGSAACEDCICCEYIMPNGEAPYVECGFKDSTNTKKETQPNSFGNRLKLKVWLDNDVNSEIGYIDGYVQKGDETLAIVYVPNRKELIALSIDDISIIKEGE